MLLNVEKEHYIFLINTELGKSFIQNVKMPHK